MGKRSLWGWGYEEQAVDPLGLAPLLADFGFRVGDDPIPVVAADTVALATARLAAPGLDGIAVTDDRMARLRHAHGRSFDDIVAGLRGDYRFAPDLVAFPEDEGQVLTLLQWCAGMGVACVPFGGGTSVVGGVQCREGDSFNGVLSLDTTRMNRVLQVDELSRAAHLQAGMLGPEVESALRPYGLTLRHYPQSFEFSSVGGWLATRAGGHFATGPTHIDDFVESLSIVTPTGVDTTRRLPASGAGPSPDRWYLGSEGTLGVITSAWLRLQQLPVHKAEASLTFASFEQALGALRALTQSGLQPSNCRVLDAGESRLAGVAQDGGAALLLGFESAQLPVEPDMEAALAVLRDHAPLSVSGPAYRERGRQARDASSGEWRRAFLSAPYLRDALVRLGLIAETFETAVTWDGLARLHAAVNAAVTATSEELGLHAVLLCRITHAYPDGLAPYFTVIAQGPGDVREAWAAVKQAVSAALISSGGTITHHHAVGRDHRGFYEEQRPDRFAAMFAAAKGSVDPAGVMNPGVLLR